MGRLFWKLFVSLSLTLVLIGAGIGGAVYLHDQRLQNEEGIQRDRRAEFVVGLVANAVRHGGIAGARALLDEWPGKNRAPRVLIVDSKGHDALGRQVQPFALEKALKALQRHRGHQSVKQVTAPDGRQYVLFLPAADASSGPPRMPPPSVQILIALFASLLFSAIFATYLTRPIRHLRRVSTRLAEGDLGARVTPLIGSRNDELSDLGKDFDFMAARLQTLLNAQRQLLHDVSHELRSPVARMRLAVGIARQQPEKVEMALDRIERETERLDELLGQILTLARLESGLSNDAKEPVSIDELLEEIIQDVGFEAQASGKAITYHANIKTRVEGQRELLRRAFENVIRNAIKYTADASNVEVTLTAESRKPTVLIRDHGPGIPEDELGKVFRPFYRLPPEKDKTQASGYGLGLAITRRALEKHAASVSLSNAADGGLRVRIQFDNASIY
jgi:two-component system OmpR family sensor kinase